LLITSRSPNRVAQNPLVAEKKVSLSRSRSRSPSNSLQPNTPSPRLKKPSPKVSAAIRKKWIDFDTT